MSVSEHYQGSRGERYQAHLANAEFYRRQQVELYFQGHVGDDDVLLDFGCNDGLFLACLPGKRKIGVEVNEAARAQKVSDDIEVYESLAPIPDGTVDVAISNHCLEHTLSPLDCLRDIYRVLKPGGKLVIVLPFDDWRGPIHRGWQPNDPDNHLFTWSPMNIGNLLTEAGFSVQTASHTQYAISNKLEPVLKYMGRSAFLAAAGMLSRYRKRSEVCAVAFKSS